jgi:hypothetical protein
MWLGEESTAFAAIGPPELVLPMSLQWSCEAPDETDSVAGILVLVP